jgi:phosphoribosyl 1,2-cyclic phosphodiesterase
MVRVSVLASGSKGNSAVVSSSTTRILVDAGLSCREILNRMRKAGEDPESLSAIVVTHEHSDHVGGLGVLARKLKVPVYITGPTHSAWFRLVKHEAKRAGEQARDLERRQFFEAGRSFQIGDVSVMPFTIPHDAADPVGFTFKAEGVKIGIVTDLGYMSANVKEHLRRSDVLMIESNHDVEMLRMGTYPWSVKQRIASRAGHLSNEDLAEFLRKDYDGGAEFVILAHLSEQNNHPERARVMAEQALGRHASLFHQRLLVATQSEVLAPVTL